MKIALLTIWHCYNYGAELQTYATVKYLQKHGHDVKVIDFREGDSLNPGFKDKVLNIIRKFTKTDKKFNSFWRKYIPLTEMHYKSLEELRNNPPVADMYLIGSDQVWNEDITHERAPLYFLDFGDSKTLRASYASSIGKAEWNGSQELTEIVSKILPTYKGISCREKSGVKLLQDIFGVNVTRVLDPTLLHGSYPELTGSIKESNMLVYYPLTVNPQIERFSKDLSLKLGLDFVNTNKQTMITNTVAWDRPSIEEWVKNIASSHFVVTPSFHGLAFSLIYHKQFIIIKNSQNTNRQSRMVDLLSELGLEDRFFDCVEDATIARIWEKTIDYAIIDQKLEAMRKESMDYLNKILS